MQTNYLDGRREIANNLTLEDVLRKTEENLQNPEVRDFTVTPNRHERRRDAAAERRKPKSQARKKRR